MGSDKIPDGLVTIETEWTICQVWDAHLYLDMIEDMAILTDRALNPGKPAR